LLQCQALWLGFAFGIRGGEGGAYPQRGGSFSDRIIFNG